MAAGTLTPHPPNREWRVLGLMSGSSLDGIDWCMATFGYVNGRWNYRIEGTGTRPFTETMVARLSEAHRLTVHEAMLLQTDFCEHSTGAAEAAVAQCGRPEIIAEHGHTVVHRPDLGYTWQMSAAPSLAACMQLPVVGDFRRVDVALGGQGAPLVPMGDRLLFSEYAACLNLGGIANVSFDRGGVRMGFDVCLANQVLNELARRIGHPFDPEGRFASAARRSCAPARCAFIETILEQWLATDAARPIPPPSLGRESLDAVLETRIEANGLRTEEALWAWCRHIAASVVYYLRHFQVSGNVLLTGGGAYNRFLLECLAESASSYPEIRWVVAPDVLITHKEALLFGFFGLLRYLRLPNTDASSTGASSSHSAGCVYEPFPIYLYI